MRMPLLRSMIVLSFVALACMALLPQRPVAAAASQPDALSYWGMNLYLTKRERIGRDSLQALGAMARDGGVRWTREELPWDLIEPRNDAFRTVYDGSLKLTADQGFGIVGMLLTTPGWARDPSCQPVAGFEYWCPPANVNEYADFARWMVERYDGDGTDDAPGSPRIAYWEIWNEPNYTKLWPNIGGGEHARKERYGRMLIAAYDAIKQADPTAKVLIGGMYIFDGACHPVAGEAMPLCDGLNFLNAPGGVFRQVPEARVAYDVFSIHPYIATTQPDDWRIPPRITVEGRVSTTRAWLNDSASGNRPDQPPIWITEIGWCTGTSALCGNGVSEDQQANYLVRSMVLAQQTGVEHTSWFQFEDAFDNPGREYSTAAIVNNYNGSGYTAKLAYGAYRTMAQQLASATPAGAGPAHTHSYAATADFGNVDDIYDYRYTRGSRSIDVLWKPSGSARVSFPVTQQPVTLIDRDGADQTLTPSGGIVQLDVSDRPIYVVQGAPTPVLQLSTMSINLLLEAEEGPFTGEFTISNGGGGTLGWRATTDVPWLTLSATAGMAPAPVSYTASTNLQPGTYSGTITVTGSGEAGSQTIPVRMIIASQVYRTGMPLVRR